MPTPALLRVVLEATETPSQDTVAWAVKLASVWEGTRKRAEIRAALEVLRVAGKHSGEFRPLGSYRRGGFGEKGKKLGKGLTQLFGPKVPDWDNYAAVGEIGIRQLQKLIDEHPFLPTADDLRLALSRLSACGDDVRRVALATDLAEFLGQVWDYYPPAGRRDEVPGMRQLLQETPWVPNTADGGGARPAELVLHDNRETLELLGDAVRAPLLPESVEAGSRWVRALEELGEKAGLTFLDAANLGREAGQAVVAGLRPRLVGKDVLRQLELVGRFLDWQWFANEANGLREMIDLSKIHAESSPGPATVWLVCETTGQKQTSEAEFPRGAVAFHHGNSCVRRAAIWASGGMKAPKDSPLDSSDCTFPENP